MSLSRAKNIFMPVNINSIVILIHVGHVVQNGRSPLSLDWPEFLAHPFCTTWPTWNNWKNIVNLMRIPILKWRFYCHSCGGFLTLYFLDPSCCPLDSSVPEEEKTGDQLHRQYETLPNVNHCGMRTIFDETSPSIYDWESRNSARIWQQMMSSTSPVFILV